VNNRYLPTDLEQSRIDRITAWRGRMLLVLIIPFGLFWITRFLPEETESLAIGGAIVTIAVWLTVIGYISFGLRCPRCSSWVGVSVPKCASCGLRFDAPTK
jgi:hypothetical protein